MRKQNLISHLIAIQFPALFLYTALRKLVSIAPLEGWLFQSRLHNRVAGVTNGSILSIKDSDSCIAFSSGNLQLVTNPYFKIPIAYM